MLGSRVSDSPDADPLPVSRPKVGQDRLAVFRSPTGRGGRGEGGDPGLIYPNRVIGPRNGIRFGIGIGPDQAGWFFSSDSDDT